MGFFDDEKEKSKQELEEQMDNLGLEEWEKEEVRNGNYNPEDFEEEDLEEDDYHYEDD